MDKDERILEMIRALLAKNFGNTAAKAIEFYVDPHIAIANPDEYSRMLQNIFGVGTGLFLRAIVSGLCAEFGVTAADTMTLADCIASLKPRGTEMPPA